MTTATQTMPDLKMKERYLLFERPGSVHALYSGMRRDSLTFILRADNSLFEVSINARNANISGNNIKVVDEFFNNGFHYSPEIPSDNPLLIREGKDEIDRLLGVNK